MTKIEACYRISDHYATKNYTTISFKIDNLKFNINFYCPTSNYISGKFIGTNILKRLVKQSSYISLKDHLSNYVFDHFEGQLINISENEILIRTINRMRIILMNFEYDVNDSLKCQTGIKLYNKIWRNNETPSFL